ncbi:sterol carrier family protein [uncultured Tessaracoccus sp.]|uniref:sterol carrier family protein n=1 Tax=uncultured Tessaracoccus sp. TaxID=905023 RepID=UPI0025E6F9F2|nr:sterol carrier family protein [uncultured Tessaracoccus sp.]
MFRPTPRVVEALRSLVDEATLDAALTARRPDLTDVLLACAREHRDLPRVLTAACTRAACRRLGELHGGHAIEVRVPPHAAVQLGFGSGPRHTRGTPPNVVELAPETFLDLVTGRVAWDDAKADVRASGAHAHDVARAFPLG